MSEAQGRGERKTGEDNRFLGNLDKYALDKKVDWLGLDWAEVGALLHSRNGVYVFYSIYNRQCCPNQC